MARLKSSLGWVSWGERMVILVTIATANTSVHLCICLPQHPLLPPLKNSLPQKITHTLGAISLAPRGDGIDEQTS
jgi:hypothetical protein